MDHRTGRWSTTPQKSRRQPDAEAAWVATVVARSTAIGDAAATARPGYYNSEGQADAKTRQGTMFFGAPTEYDEVLEPGVPTGIWPGSRSVARRPGRD